MGYVEHRIEMLDQKADILMAIAGGMYVLVLTAVNLIVGGLSAPGLHGWTQIVLFGLLGIGLIVSFRTIQLLVLTLRPGDIRGRSPVREGVGHDRYLMWPSAEITENVAEYLARVHSLTSEEIVLNLAKTHHNSLVMVERKYRFYRSAVRGMHAVIILSFAALAWALLIKVI